MAWQPAAPAQHIPAYSAVPARTTLERPPLGSYAAALSRPSPTDPSQNPPPTAAAPRKVSWSDSVKSYVRRAFDPDNAMPDISAADMKIKLKEIISYHAERNLQDEVDWATHPLPQQIIAGEREAAARAALAAQPNSPAPAYGKSIGPTFSPGSKRKSLDADELQAAASVPPWRKANLESRVTFGDGQNKRQKKSDFTKETISKLNQLDLEKRKQRFQANQNDTTPPWRSDRDSDSEMSTAPVVGTNQSLEKSYFRLTSQPKPETVRPLHVLEKTLDLLRKKWRQEKNYNYICNQFKSLRQDLTVQHIKNAFTVRVYENHARIALEKGDLGEYNQCQTQLKALYGLGLGGHPGEFLAYRILYFVYTCNKTDMNDVLAELTPTDKALPEVKHALEVRSSLALGNYHKFFRLYLDAPNMGGYLMDMFVERERLNALSNISKAYHHVFVRFLTNELGFENDEECLQFLRDHGAQHLIEEKETDNGPKMRVRVKEAMALFDQLRAAAFSKVDLKGQI
ncbi:hypothetical protein M011DRAFT_400295 [Sporormia fimetaria CBS 119925]|uniref:PCI domain-containing protein n=1 Tax=Sporormia fimetaria CBS 119925 TaxID=1340428 RepID=A0A6A6VGU0_9PLEO|nr:hypothetical protein M011DRAFT_400295 [Sporormia fimetaria CBS 119925]